MPTSCSVYGCSNRFCKEKKIQFFTFPFKDEDRLAAWITAVHRKDWKPSKASRICSAHFRPQDFLHRPGTAWYPYIRRLKHDAVPSIFSNFPERSGSKKTRIKKEHFASAVANRESKYSIKSESNFTAPEAYTNGLKPCSDQPNPCTKELKVVAKEYIRQEVESESTDSEKDQIIAKLRDKIRTLKRQVIKRDGKIRRMQELILRLWKHGSNAVILELPNESRMSVIARRTCRGSVAPHIS